MFDWNYDNVITNVEKMEKEILALDTRYSTTKSFLDSIEIVRRSVSCCHAPKIQTYDNFCGNCGADMGKL